MLPLSRWVGARLPRVEDERLLRGEGEFRADLHLPGALHAVFVRSEVPHALVRGVAAERARGIRGVAAVLTGRDLPHEPLVDLLPVEGLRRTPQPALATDRARFVGEAVALVLGASRYEAEDGAELVEVDYEPLPHVIVRGRWY